MNKERAIRIAVLSAVFVLAIIIFSILTNRDSVGMTADMNSATLPTISFKVAGKEVNTLVGHKREMNLVDVRDTITVYKESGNMEVLIQKGQNEISTLSYEIYTLDGQEKLYEGSVDQVGDSVKLKIGVKLSTDQEAVLKICLMQSETPVYYYTRIVKEQDNQITECLKYVEELHTNILNKQNEDDVKKVMEPNTQGNNKSLQHVTIHSDLKHVMWGDLNPKLINSVKYEIKEAKVAYTSVILKYQVACAGDNNEEEIYNVQEFFKVVYGTERIYLLEYDRTMEEVFDTSNVVLNSKGIVLGFADSQVPYKINQDGTFVAFVQANELWSFNRNDNEFSLVFSFVSSEKYDERNYTNNHNIRILSMENNGNMTFTVSGYMNRGDHEGESGIAIYYYHMEKSYVEEVAFVPSTLAYPMMEEILCESAYYNQAQDVLYLLSNGTLRKIEMKNISSTILVEGLKEGAYVASEDGHWFAYQKKEADSVKTVVWDFSKDTQKEIVTEEGNIVVPLGFIEDDFVYGISRVENAGYDMLGKEIQAMHLVEIRNTDNEVVKTYEQENVYVLRAIVKDDMITLTQGVKDGSLYKETSEDYITNNETSSNTKVELKSYWSDLKETQYRFVFAESFNETKTQTLRPKMLLQEGDRVIQLEESSDANYYYAFGYGRVLGVYKNAGEAIEMADKYSGVVVSTAQNYVWEDGNKESYYHNFDISAFTINSEETSFITCVKKVLAYEGKSINVGTELNATTAQQVLSENIGTEVICFHNCSVKSVFYLIDKGVPVIGMKDSANAILLIGYDAQTATYIDPTNGGVYRSNIDKIDTMLEGSGNTFIGYIR